MDSRELQLVEIVNLNDDLFLPWLDLFETAFPAPERVLVSSQLQLLRAKMAGATTDHHLLAALDGERALVGMLQYQVLPKIPAAFLWYFAIKPNERSKGLGSQMYQAMLKRLGPASPRAIIFEVEIPDDAPSDEQRRLAERRITFYRRLGARLLGGVHYIQQVGWHQPPIPMHVMLQPLLAMDPHDAYQLAKEVFEDSITQIGTPTLD